MQFGHHIKSRARAHFRECIAMDLLVPCSVHVFTFTEREREDLMGFVRGFRFIFVTQETILCLTEIKLISASLLCMPYYVDNITINTI